LRKTGKDQGDRDSDPEPQADFDDYQHNDNDFLQNSDGSLAPTDIDHKDTASTEGSVSHSENEQHELPETPLSDTPMQHSLDIDSPLLEPLNEKSKNHE
jgi:hypothetical protein